MFISSFAIHKTIKNKSMIHFRTNTFDKATFACYVISVVLLIVMIVAQMPELLALSIVIAVLGKMLDNASNLMIEENKTYNRK